MSTVIILLLEVTHSLFSSMYVGANVRSLKASPALTAYTGVSLVVADDVTYFAGNETGRVLRVQCPWGTQEMAEYLLLKVRGTQYQPYSAAGVITDPAIELGDGISINTIHGGVYSLKSKFGRSFVTDASAPVDEEVDYEYPYKPASERQATRQHKQVLAALQVNKESIDAKVSSTSSGSSFGWTLVADSWSLYSNKTKVFHADKSGIAVTGRIVATSGQIGNCIISEAGVLEVPVACIKGKLTAEHIDATNLQVEAANVVGVLTAATLSVQNITAGSNDKDITFSGAFTATRATITGHVTANTGRIGSWNVGVNPLLAGVYEGTALYTDPYYEDGVELTTTLTPEKVYVHYRRDLEVATYSATWLDILRIANA